VASADPEPRKIERAVLATDDKAGLGELARALVGFNVELWATRGTARAIQEAGVPVHSLEELTGVASWFDGRVKTLHPAVFGGILAPRTPAGLGELADRQLLGFDLVAVNFYPFERHLKESPQATDREEFIDIGGVALARAAAKNHRFVTVLTDPEQYAPLLEEMRRADGVVSAETRRRLAVLAFERCTEYDAAIVRGLAEEAGDRGPFPEEIVLRRDAIALRYGENPHQKAATYRTVGAGTGFVPIPLALVKGAALSFNNLLDLEAAVATVGEFSRPAAAVVKHATPCGVAVADSVHEALAQALATDPVARYGCAIAVNRPFGPEDPPALKGVFVDLLAAPEYATSALEAVEGRAKLKVLKFDPATLGGPGWEAKSALGRVLLQETDRRELASAELKHICGPALSADDLNALGFAWRVVRHAKSNAIALAVGSATVGIGSGQPTRVKAAELACEVAGPRARGAVLASDAFFPFPDGVEAAGRAGVRAVVQPGGSLLYPDATATTEKFGMSMYFTGWRVFRH
jgi:phosphoribosylaminoimidazolecarboxamide formyltransferase / IMP cyclohydrolase